MDATQPTQRCCRTQLWMTTWGRPLLPWQPSGCARLVVVRRLHGWQGPKEQCCCCLGTTCSAVPCSSCPPMQAGNLVQFDFYRGTTVTANMQLECVECAGAPQSG